MTTSHSPRPRDTTDIQLLSRGLKHAIKAGVFRPGGKLASGALEVWLGASPSSVRDALKVLEAEGLVEMGDSRVARVAPRPAADARAAMAFASSHVAAATRATFRDLEFEGKDAIGVRITDAWDTAVLHQPAAHEKARARLIDTLLDACADDDLAERARRSMETASVCLNLSRHAPQLPWRQLDLGYEMLHRALRDGSPEIGELGMKAVLCPAEVEGGQFV